jgi:hypothetical protein
MLDFDASWGCAARRLVWGGLSALPALLVGCDGGRLSSNDAYNEPVDRDAPVVVWYSPSEGAQVQGLVDLQVQVTDDDGPPRLVGFAINGQPLQQLTAPPWSWPWDTGGLPPGRYVLSATATDAGNKNTTADLTVEVAPREGAGPIVRIVEPSQEYVGPRARLALDARTSDGVPLRSVSLRLDGQEFSALTAPPWEYVWDTTAFSEGPHTLEALATDDLGREALDSEPILLDHTPPTLLGVEVLGRQGSRVRVLAEVEDASPVEEVTLVTPTDELVLDDGPPWEARLPLRAGDPGTQELTLRARDSAGNELETQVSVQLDATPQVRITSPSDGARVPPSFSVEVEASDDAPGWELELWADDVLQPGWSPSNSQWTAPRVVADRRLRVVVRDSLGQTSQHEITVRVDPGFAPIQASLLGCEAPNTPAPSCAPMLDGPLTVTEEGFSVFVRVEGLLEQVQEVTLQLEPLPAQRDGQRTQEGQVELRRFVFDSAQLPEGPHRATAKVKTTTGTTWLVYGEVLLDHCDADGDDHRAMTCQGGDDCDDAEPLAHPGGVEVCGDAVDNDCEGTADVLEGEACP